MKRLVLLTAFTFVACTRERDPDPPPSPEPPAMDHVSAPETTPDPTPDTEATKAERTLLSALAHNETTLPPGDPAILPALAALAEHYTSHARWDEMSMLRSRMLALTPPRSGPGPAPGGPFPRIGLPDYDSESPPRTLLSRWLNRRVLPELYETPEVSERECESRRRAAVASAPANTRAAADAHADLAAILAAQARLTAAITEYERALPQRPDVQPELTALRAIVTP